MKHKEQWRLSHLLQRYLNGNRFYDCAHSTWSKIEATFIDHSIDTSRFLWGEELESKFNLSQNRISWPGTDKNRAL